MKNFLKTTLAVIIGSLVAMAICTFLFFGLVGSLAALGDSQEPVVPAKDYRPTAP